MRKRKDCEVGISEIQGMFEVHRTTLNKEVADFYNWDFDKVFRGVFINGFCEHPLEAGDVYLATLLIANGVAKFIECSPKWESEEIDYGDDDEDEASDAVKRPGSHLL